VTITHQVCGGEGVVGGGPRMENWAHVTVWRRDVDGDYRCSGHEVDCSAVGSGDDSGYGDGYGGGAGAGDGYGDSVGYGCDMKRQVVDGFEFGYGADSSDGDGYGDGAVKGAGAGWGNGAGLGGSAIWVVDEDDGYGREFGADDDGNGVGCGWDAT